MNDQTDFTTINPFTNQKLKTYQYHAVDQVNEIIHLAHNSWLSFKESSYYSRAEKLRKAATILEENKEKYAEMMSLEMGKV
jgi:succinate-semialdehyde dehydrogenase/glutarate-semialdehyde dehydrogenase